ncbi:MAG: dephospho-CoA kinase, partial [Acidobacteria bacterium]|nr:dephospho-CoA kinase [Acidobacteriota bacterium]
MLGGGIGSGKSAVRVLLERSGVETIDADSIGHEVLEHDGAPFAS